MKGTTARGKTHELDLRKRAWLKADAKTRAENLMIVDLLRNDLGRICTKGSVKTRKLFDIEEYRTLHQMTSTIEGRLEKYTSLQDIFSSLFPCGSVTGAPKIRTMEIIKELEREPRSIYAGAIGYMHKKRMCFNVAIRTVVLDQHRGNLGIGGGIVYDSLDVKEYKEAILKANFLTSRAHRATTRHVPQAKLVGV